jgi:hypothetical protein
MEESCLVHLLSIISSVVFASAEFYSCLYTNEMNLRFCPHLYSDGSAQIDLAVP